MKRYNNFEVRPDFKDQLMAIGMNYWDAPSGPDNLPYWQENVMYAFSEGEIDRILEATQELHNMTIEMVGQIVDSGDFPEYFKLTELEKSMIEQSWKRGDKSLYGRFDLALGEDNSLKMFEYNGDTPVSILECAVGQWHKVEQAKTLPNGQPFPEEFRTQFNLIDETLAEVWPQITDPNKPMFFASSGGFRHEDFGNLVYLMDSALRSGMQVKEIQMEDIGLNLDRRPEFRDLDDKKIEQIFKLYPWEWITEENFGKYVQKADTKWFEPEWKMLLSNKAMLIKLWEMFPNHPNLLASYIKQPSRGLWAKKAIHGREGSNIYLSRFADGEQISNVLAPGSHKVEQYDHWGYMYQQWHNVKKFDGYYPNFGSWVIGDTACGMSIREDQNVVTGNNAFFASHFFVPEGLEAQYEGLWK